MSLKIYFRSYHVKRICYKSWFPDFRRNFRFFPWFSEFADFPDFWWRHQKNADVIKKKLHFFFHNRIMNKTAKFHRNSLHNSRDIRGGSNKRKKSPVWIGLKTIYESANVMVYYLRTICINDLEFCTFYPQWQHLSLWEVWLRRTHFIQVIVDDRPTSKCKSTGDPHIWTFDNTFFDLHHAGDFIMARKQKK